MLSRLLTVSLIVLAAAPFARRAAAGETHPEYLKAVRAYADALLEKGRDTYGKTRSPLIAATLDRKTLRLFEGDGLQRIRSIPRKNWGIRSHDRVLTGANPMHDQNLYQVLYALAEVTGEDRYAEEADKALQWFFTHCQSPTTGLMAWGEHIGWDFRKESVAGNTHEYFRPWVLWDRSFELAPDACARFARGVWDHQIGDQKTGNFSRHASWKSHGPGTNSEYPRHGGFYIATWAAAYEKTKDEVFLEAIETLVGYFEGRRSPESGAIPAESHRRSKGNLMWPQSNVSLAVDLWDGAPKVPEALAAKMRACAQRTDEVFLRIPHDLRPDGKGFVKACNTHTLAAGDVRSASRLATTRLWATGYGDATDAAYANLCLLRYRQRKLDGYRSLILGAANRYLDSEPNIKFPVYPGTLGDVIWLLVGAHEMTGEGEYLDRANHFADAALAAFLTDGCPLPRATDKHDHYEAITRADTLMMALLKLWAVHNRPDADLRLVYNDR